MNIEHTRPGRKPATELLRPIKEHEPPTHLRRLLEEMETGRPWLIERYTEARKALESPDVLQGQVSETAWFAFHLLILYPDIRKELHLNESLYEQLQEAYPPDEEIELRSQLNQIELLMLLFPDRQDEIRSVYHTNDVLQEAITTMKGMTTTNEISDFSDMGRAIITIAPEKKSQLPLEVFTAEQRQEWARNKLDRKLQSEDIALHTLRFAGYNMLYPDHQEDFQINTLLPLALEDLNMVRNDAQEYAFRLAYIALMAAQEVNIDAKGVHMRYLSNPSKPLPLPDRSVV